MSMTPNETTALARYFVKQVERARDALSACKLGKYADEVCIMLPKNASDFEKFVHWTEAVRETFRRWSSLSEVRQNHESGVLDGANEALRVLATDARSLLSQHQVRLNVPAKGAA